MGVGLYVVAVSISGSIIVYRNELSPSLAVEWLVKLHENLLFGETGRLINGIGALLLTVVCLTGAVIWWPGVKNWRRSLHSEVGSAFCAVQLGPAQRPRVLELPFCSDVGSFRNLFRLSGCI